MSRTQRESRLAGSSAIAFAVLLFVYVILIDLPDLTTTDGQTISFYEDAGHRAQSIVGGYVATLTAFLFIIFVVGSVRLLSRRDSKAAAVAAGVGGTTFVALFLTAAALFTAPAFTLSLNNEPVALDEDFALAARSTSMVADAVFLMFAPFAAAVFVMALTLGARRAAGWPRWLAILGCIVGVFLATPLIFFSLLLLMIWCVAVGVHMLTGPRRADTEESNVQDVAKRTGSKGVEGDGGIPAQTGPATGVS